MVKEIYLVADDEYEIMPVCFENKKDAVKYACNLQRDLARDTETEHYSSRDLKEHYTKCADGNTDYDYSVNGIYLQKVKYILTKS